MMTYIAQQEDAEKPLRVGPALVHLEPGLERQAGELVEAVFVGIFGMNAFALGKGDAPAGHRHDLIGKALEIDLDAAFRLVIEGFMGKAAEIEIALELR